MCIRDRGAGSFFIIFKEVLPNIIGPIITQVMFSIPTAIFTEAFLSFVGLGIPVPQCSLGSLISELYNSFTTHPYQIIPPMVVMSLLLMSFNLVADGLHEALDPKMKSCLLYTSFAIKTKNKNQLFSVVLLNDLDKVTPKTKKRILLHL